MKIINGARNNKIMTIQEKISQEWLADEPNMTKIRQLEYQLALLNGTKEIQAGATLMQELDDLQAIQELDLTRELKRTRDQSSLLGLSEIAKIMRDVFNSAELEWLKKNI